MLHRPKSRALLAGAALLSFLTPTGPAHADTYYETVFLPTSSVVSIPTSSVLATSYVMPTSYTSSYLPTSAVYSTDSFLIPTTTTYRRSLFRPRRYVERTSYSLAETAYYSPTSYLLPTSYLMPTSYVVPTTYVPTSYVSSSYITPTSYLIDTGIVTTSASLPCETTSSVAPPRPTPIRNTAGSGSEVSPMVSKPSNVGNSNERPPSAILNNSPQGDESMPSNVNPPVPGPVQTPAPKSGAGAANSPLAEPPTIDTGTPPAAPTNANEGIKIKPPGETGSPASPDETTLRSLRRPIYETRNILRGRVISAETKRPEEGVSVVASSLTKNYGDRPAMTDADGEFKISLPDGDWTVKVKMPSGTIFTVGRDYVTASNGKVTDASGRNVAEFLITR